MRKGIVWLTEDEDEGFLEGTFSGFHDLDPRLGEECFGLPLPEALAWARERADQVCVELGDHRRFSAGAKPLPDFPAWPPDDLPEPVRRRPPGQEWRDRTEADAPIDWTVTAWIARADGRLGEDDELIRALAERAGAVRWDRKGLDGVLADMPQARGDEAVGWFSYHRPAYRLVFTAGAPTADQAQALVSGRLDLPAGWVAELETAPA